MEHAWGAMAGRFEAYRMVSPGDQSFICQPETCNAHCCRAFSVSLGEREAERMRRSSGRAWVEFLETDGDTLIELPLAQPYLLKRTEGKCHLLLENLACGEYHGRPDACRLYPHFVIMVDRQSGKPVHGDVAGIRAATERALTGALHERLLPLLLRHVECPGFTGPPLSDGDWFALLERTARLQYPAGWPGVSPVE